MASFRNEGFGGTRGGSLEDEDGGKLLLVDLTDAVSSAPEVQVELDSSFVKVPCLTSLDDEVDEVVDLGE